MKELPIFPLQGVVLFPGCILPLHVFERRYRRMVDDVRERDSRFGVINVNNSGLAEVGCIAQIVSTSKLNDGRYNIVTIGVERFALIKEAEETDYPKAVIQEFPENPESARVSTYMTQASAMLLEVLRLSARLAGSPVDLAVDIPRDPRNLSFLIAASLPSSPDVKQDLLEMKDTDLRLAREIGLLDEFAKRLGALIAIEGAFKKTL